jgi:ribokinase
MDIVNFVDKPPLPGETIKGFSTQYIPGGKGANQAVAASLSGGNVTMIGAVGDDMFAPALLDALLKQNIKTEHIKTKRCNSGLAFITVNKNGQNSIILSEGANGEVNTTDIPDDVFEGIAAVLLQNEIPWHVTKEVIKQAKRLGVKVYFNPAPSLAVPKEILELVDVLVLNETEAETITGITIKDQESAKKAIIALRLLGTKTVVLTMGEKGSLYSDPEIEIHTPAFQVQVNDTTAAGDTFIGALAVASKNQPIAKALQFATAASAIAVTRKGAQSSVPTKIEIENFLEKHQ